jgi:hypothetical protein
MSSSAYRQFLRDLDVNKKYEQEASKRIKNYFNVEIKNFCDNHKYDFKDCNNIKYEVKTNHNVFKFHSYFIEFDCNGKPSGIFTTQSNYYILCDIKNYYLIDTQKLINLCKSCKIVKCKNGNIGYIFPEVLLLKNSIKI